MTRIVKNHDVRRQEILDTAQRLFNNTGYEQTSIQTIIDEIGIAKGTFYHYFQSKAHLLDELIDQMVCATLERVEPILQDDQLNALEKLHQFFYNVEQWKLDNKAFFLDILRAWFSDENLVFRTRLEAAQLRSFSVKFSAIIQQGCEEGLFTSPHPQETAQIILAVLQDLSKRMLAFILDEQENEDISPILERHFISYQSAIERLLKAAPGSIQLFKIERWKQWL